MPPMVARSVVRLVVEAVEVSVVSRVGSMTIELVLEMLGLDDASELDSAPEVA